MKMSSIFIGTYIGARIGRGIDAKSYPRPQLVSPALFAESQAQDTFGERR
jgi:hypothetical protein